MAAVDGEHRNLTPLTDCLYKIVYRSIRRISKMLILKELVLEARVGIEPTNKGFADLCLTTWLPRPGWLALNASYRASSRQVKRYRSPKPCSVPQMFTAIPISANIAAFAANAALAAARSLP